MVDISQNFSYPFEQWLIDWEKVIKGLIEREKEYYVRL